MTHAKRFLRVAGWTLWLVLALTVSAYWVESAKAPEQTEDDPRFTGVSTSMESTNLSIGRRHFEAGARSAWHYHDHGQLLFVEKGRARTQKRGEAMREMGPGESDYTPPKVEHWHGAAPHEDYVQVHVIFGPGITWLEKTTDEQYNGTSR